MSVDNKTESSAVMNALFPFVVLPFLMGSIGPGESAGLVGTYGEESDHPPLASGESSNPMTFGNFGDFGTLP